MTSQQPQFIFISGGYDNSCRNLNDVERYDSKRDIWESLPGLNLARYRH